MDSPVFVEDGQSALVNQREGVELVETESTVGGEEEDATQGPKNADCIGVDNSDWPGDVRELEPHAELSASSVDTQPVVAETDSSIRPSRQRKPPSQHGTWVTD